MIEIRRRFFSEVVAEDAAAEITEASNSRAIEENYACFWFFTVCIPLIFLFNFEHTTRESDVLMTNMLKAMGFSSVRYVAVMGVVSLAFPLSSLFRKARPYRRRLAESLAVKFATVAWTILLVKTISHLCRLAQSYFFHDSEIAFAAVIAALSCLPLLRYSGGVIDFFYHWALCPRIYPPIKFTWLFGAKMLLRDRGGSFARSNVKGEDERARSALSLR